MAAGVTEVNDDNGRPLDVISLTAMTVDCIVGIYGPERHKTQPLTVRLELFLDTRGAATAGISGTVDYARLAGEVRFLLESCRFKLLETAAEALARYILAPPTADAPRARVHAATVELTKPDALPGHAVPSLRVHRRASDMQYAVEKKGFGEVDVVHEGSGYGIYRLRVRPGGFIPTHVHKVMEEHELILGSGLLLQGKPVARGTAFHWPKDFPHRYDNPTATEQTILCVDSPAFIPTDEVEVAQPAGGLTEVKGERYYPTGDEP